MSARFLSKGIQMNDYIVNPGKGYTISRHPEPVGYYDMGNCRVAVTRKPNWFQRLMIEWCFGWTWCDL